MQSAPCLLQAPAMAEQPGLARFTDLAVPPGPHYQPAMQFARPALPGRARFTTPIIERKQP